MAAGSDLEGTSNFRDVGGLPLVGGGEVASGVFFRSDALHALTPRGVEELSASPIADLVDFRTAVERDTARDRLPPGRRIREHHLPLLEGAMSHLVEKALAAHLLGDRVAAARAVERAVDDLPTLGDMYTGMLEHGASSFARVVRLIAAPGAGGVLVHCTAGKDRTGVCAALVLDAAGVRRDAIVDDYAASEGRLAGTWFDRMTGMVTAMGVEVTPALAEIMGGSPRPAMEQALAWVDEHGGAAQYLRSGGASDDDLHMLRERLTA